MTENVQIKESVLLPVPENVVILAGVEKFARIL